MAPISCKVLTTCIANILSAGLGAVSFHTSTLLDPAHYSSGDIIVRDVAVIGGGSSGTYGTIKLKDLGKSVILVEKEARLGGHVNTYFDPGSGTPIDYGVQAFWNLTVALDYFARFDIPLVDYSFAESETEYADFRTGHFLPNFTYSFDLSKYAEQLHRFPKLDYSWNISYPVPEELLMSFGDLITTYGLEDEVWGMHTILDGVANPADILDSVTLNIFKWLDNGYIAGAEGADRTTQKPEHYNAELYEKALAELQTNSSVLLNSTVAAADRQCTYGGQGICVAVRTSDGYKLILAKKLLISIPPVPWNMQPFGLDSNEQVLFDKWNYSGYYTGLLANSGLDPNVTYYNTGANTSYNLPVLPGAYFFQPTNVEGVIMYWYAGPDLLSQEQVEADVLDQLRRITSQTQTPDFLAFGDHSPFKLVVSADDIANGFYRDLMALQGKNNTWYTGAAFATHNSVELWNYTSSLMPDILESLGPSARVAT
ncbi:Beta-cyclopiazonate dehydrogenase [Cytospora mali]|uniref:Beta-cyclopiazonate dehydrogenase n=1 Tax=Cytospora mali TaxID=578113 RepID=A0A194V8P4_CYTMA|nr:Beta-cyclopiazonate dehydrogenase [Valsa mali var. pyri (nom. inval.)]